MKEVLSKEKLERLICDELGNIAYKIIAKVYSKCIDFQEVKELADFYNSHGVSALVKKYCEIREREVDKQKEIKSYFEISIYASNYIFTCRCNSACSALNAMISASHSFSLNLNEDELLVAIAKLKSHEISKYETNKFYIAFKQKIGGCILT